jgi:hypothetical protein
VWVDEGVTRQQRSDQGLTTGHQHVITLDLVLRELLHICTKIPETGFDLCHMRAKVVERGMWTHQLTHILSVLRVCLQSISDGRMV